MWLGGGGREIGQAGYLNSGTGTIVRELVWPSGNELGW